MTARARPGSARGGFVGGLEVLPFAVLVFVLGTVLIVNAWAVVDAKLAVEAAAREATRAYVEAGDATSAERASVVAAHAAFAASGRPADRLQVQHGATEYVRCAPVAFEVTYRVRAVPIPIIGGLGHDITVVGRHREIIDPFAAGFGRENRCGF